MLAPVLVLAAGALLFDGTNHAPEWDPATTPKEATGSETSSIRFVVRATDADHDPLTYSLSGLPVGANAEPIEGAVQVSWSPGAKDLGVYPVRASVTDGKTTVTRTIAIVVEEEHESFFMPGAGYALWVPGDVATYGVFQGVSIELLGIRWVHQNQKHGPSHGRVYLDFDVLFSTRGDVDATFMPLAGFDLSFEKNPGRRFLIPFFGLEGGVLFQKETTTLGLVTPFAGVLVWSSRNLEIALKTGYMLPFTSEEFGQVAGLRARLTADVAFW